MGTFCSFLLVTVTIAYAYTKLDVLIYRKDVDVVSSVKNMHFDYSFVFEAKNGLNVAAAFTSYDSEREWILEPEYGELVFNSFTWGPNPDGSYFTERKKLDSHICTRDELGLDGNENANFLPLHEAGASFIDTY